MELRKPVFTADGRIDCEINHPKFGWIPFTADENDGENHGRAIFGLALAAKPAEYVAKPSPIAETLRRAMQLTRRQVFIGMADAGLITAPEAIAAAANGTPPAAIEAVFLAMPLAQQTSARITFGAFQTAYRTDPLTEILRQIGGLSAEQMDTFFTTYAAI